MKRKLGLNKAPKQDMSVIGDVALALDETIGGNEADESKFTTKILTDHIRRVSNPRVTYVTFEELKATPWPSLDTEPESLKEAMTNAVTGQDWFDRLSSSREKAAAIDFFIGIHELCCGMLSESQLQPIILERSEQDPRLAFLLGGERRTLAALYSRGEIPELDAIVWKGPLSPLQRARIKDAENTNRADLSTYELLLSKMAIYDALDNASELKTEKVAKHLGYRTLSIPSLMRRLFDSPDRDALLARIREEGIGIKEIGSLVPKKKGADRKPTQKSPTLTKSAANYGLKVSKKTDITLIQQLITAALKTDELSLSVRNAFANEDLSTAEGLLKAWSAAGDSLRDKKG